MNQIVIEISKISLKIPYVLSYFQQIYKFYVLFYQDSHPSGLEISEYLNAYNSTSHPASHGVFTTAGCPRQSKSSSTSSDSMIVSHSSRWKALKEAKKGKHGEDFSSKENNTPSSISSNSNTTNPNSTSIVVRTVEGGYKSLGNRALKNKKLWGIFGCI